MTEKRIKAWYFAPADRRLPHDDGRFVRAGIVHSVEGEIVPCSNGLHASVRAIDALSYASGPIACRVECWGDIVEHDGDKIVARHRRYLATADATKVLRLFARQCALDVIHLWDPPDVVARYLKTGDESIRVAAALAAGAQSWAARVAARAAARAAREAAREATAWVATAWVARVAAREAEAALGAAREAEAEKQNERLENMLCKLLRCK